MFDFVNKDNLKKDNPLCTEISTKKKFPREEDDEDWEKSDNE
jgi:hypothetical protein